MNNFQMLLEKYANLIVKTGVNLQKNQIVILRAPLESYELVRTIARVCYKNGASYVHTEYIDSLLDKEKLLHGPKEAIEYFPTWKADGYEEFCKKGACFIRISGDDPDVFADVPSEIMGLSNKVNSLGMKRVNKYTMSSELSWVVAGGATPSWAKKVFPLETPERALELLWEKIFMATRLDSADPVLAWNNHDKTLHEKADYLNKMQFKALHYTSPRKGNNKGTDLTIELPLNHIWAGGGENNGSGNYFIANLPTEEVFTAPKRDGINGYISSSLPFNCNGNLVENFVLSFENGRVVEVTAEKGLETLKELIATDEGASYIGEVALVPYDSPISNSGIIFLNTLFDENASCHLAFGEAYPTCIQDGEKMSEEERRNNGLNTSLIHNDFMVGTKELNITAITHEGDKVEIFKNGNWAI